MAQVQGVGAPVTRETLVSNAAAVESIVKVIGNRVSVPTLQVHIAAVYRMVEKMVDRTLNLFHMYFFWTENLRF